MKTKINIITTILFLLLFKLNAQVCNTVQADFCSYTEGATTSFVFSGNATGVTSYLWDFGDGTTSTLANPVKVFTSTGTFQSCLTLTCVVTTSSGGGGGYGGGGNTTTTTCSDFHCDNISISSFGCTDPVAVNFSVLATVDDGSCNYCVYGCMDPTASNYNPSANCDDNSCLDVISKYFCDDFESYNLNDYLTYASPVWGTWSNPLSFGCNEDVQVNNSPIDLAGIGGTQAIHFSSISSSGGPQDIVCPFGTSTSYTTGVFIFAADFIVQGSPNTGAYFNFQSNYNIGIGWALEVFMQQNGNIIFSNNLNNNLLTGSFPLETWFELKIAVNITNNQWYVYIDDLLIGSFSNGINQLASLDLFPLNGNSFWVDNVCYSYDHISVYGCTDLTAINYNMNATWNDGSCTYCVYGCTDSTQSNYDALATCDDGSCIPFTYGCTDPNALNYNPTSNTDDGSCLYPGCIDSLATNYDPTANLDDGTCIYPTCSEDVPTGLFTSNVIHNRATINWDNMNSALCFVDQYRIQYREVGASSWSQKTMSGPVGSCNFASQKTDKLILNLTTNTNYEYQMKAWYCGGGASSWSDIKTFTTLDNCPNVGNLAVYGATPTKATFTWDASNGVYSFVRLKARVDSISNPTGADFFQIGGAGVSYGTNTKNKNGLTPGETYRGQARTYCDPNGGPWKSLSWTSLVYWTQPTVRLEAGDAIANLDVYPNPSKDVFNVTFTSEDVQDLEVRVINIVGDVIYTENLQQFVGEYTKSIDLATYTKGVYFLEITTNNGIVNRKLISQ